MKKVFIGVGHGGKDTGAIGIGGLKEKDLNLNIARACREVLERHNVKVLLSRVTDEDDPASQEVRECNAFTPDLAVDIHNNAGGGDGAEVYYHHLGGVGKSLATHILNEIVNAGQNSRGIKIRKNSSGQDYYTFIRDTKSPAVIVECAFVDNTEDIRVVDTPQGQEQMGVAIAKGILKQLNINYTDNKIYRVQVGAFNTKSNALDLQNKLKTKGFNSIIKEEQI